MEIIPKPTVAPRISYIVEQVLVPTGLKPGEMMVLVRWRCEYGQQPNLYFAMRNLPGQQPVQFPIHGAIDPFDAMEKSEQAWIDFQAAASLRTPPNVQELAAMASRRPA